LGCYHFVYELEKGGGKTEHTVQFNKKKKKKSDNRNPESLMMDGDHDTFILFHKMNEKGWGRGKAEKELNDMVLNDIMPRA